MKNIIFRLALVLLATSFMSSCVATHSGYMVNSASLSSNNFHYVRTDARAKASATYFLGIGGYQHRALVAEAKQILIAKTGLSDNQALANVTVNWKTKITFLGLVLTKTCSISADIVEFE